VVARKKSEAAQVALDEVVTNRAPFQCIGCDRRFTRDGSKDGHTCEVSEKTRSAIQQSESEAQPRKYPSKHRPLFVYHLAQAAMKDDT
jgi:hypothetical protein